MIAHLRYKRLDLRWTDMKGNTQVICQIYVIIFKIPIDLHVFFTLQKK